MPSPEAGPAKQSTPKKQFSDDLKDPSEAVEALKTEFLALSDRLSVLILKAKKPSKESESDTARKEIDGIMPDLRKLKEQLTHLKDKITQSDAVSKDNNKAKTDSKPSSHRTERSHTPPAPTVPSSPPRLFRTGNPRDGADKHYRMGDERSLPGLSSSGSD